MANEKESDAMTSITACLLLATSVAIGNLVSAYIIAEYTGIADVLRQMAALRQLAGE